MTRLLLVLLSLWCGSASTHAAARFGEYAAVEFAPARGQTFAIPVVLDRAAEVAIDLFTADGDRIRTLRGAQPLPPGAHTLIWDGKDEAGLVVPDEAYVPVLRVKSSDGDEQILDPRQTSGGEVVEDLRVEITPDRDIAYTLPAPSRVLIRAGIKGGPMLRSLATWPPRGPGRNVQRWDGRDASNLIDLRAEPALSVLVTAFQLPAHAILTSGQPELSYRAYRAQKSWPAPERSLEDLVLHRGERRISRHYYAPRFQDADPRVTLRLSPDLPRDGAGLPVVALGQSVPVTAHVADEDRWLLDESLYEVAFFIDHAFVSEEEQGYLPLTWLWTANDLAPGPHLLTVNVAGFSGKVGVASVRFVVK